MEVFRVSVDSCRWVGWVAQSIVGVGVLRHGWWVAAGKQARVQGCENKCGRICVHSTIVQEMVDCFAQS